MIFRPQVPATTAAELLELARLVVLRSPPAPDPIRPLRWVAPTKCDSWKTPEEVALTGTGSCVSLSMYTARRLLDSNPDADVRIACSDRTCDGQPCDDEHVWLIVDGEIVDPSVAALMPPPPAILYQESISMPIQDQNRVAGCPPAGCRSDPSGPPYKRERVAGGLTAVNAVGNPGSGAAGGDFTRWIVAGGIVGQDYPWVRPYLRQVLAGVEAAAASFQGLNSQLAQAGDPEARQAEWNSILGVQQAQEQMRPIFEILHDDGAAGSFVNEWRKAVGHNPVSTQQAVRGVRALQNVQAALNDPPSRQRLAMLLRSPPWPAGQRPGNDGLNALALFICAEAYGFQLYQSLPMQPPPPQAPQPQYVAVRTPVPLPGVALPPPWRGPRLLPAYVPASGWGSTRTGNQSPAGNVSSPMGSPFGNAAINSGGPVAGGSVYNITDNVTNTNTNDTQAQTGNDSVLSLPQNSPGAGGSAGRFGGPVTYGQPSGYYGGDNDFDPPDDGGDDGAPPYDDGASIFD